jgi:hypothetical protein
VGETDDLGSRLAAHRRGLGREGVSFVCLGVASRGRGGGGGKSMARRVEAALIRELWYRGFPLLSLADGAHSRFGAA